MLINEVPDTNLKATLLSEFENKYFDYFDNV